MAILKRRVRPEPWSRHRERAKHRWLVPFPELGDPKRRNLYGIGYRMAGVACPRVNQYENLTSIGARLLLAAERVGYAELTASTKRRENEDLFVQVL